jgi:hypothetical protein
VYGRITITTITDYTDYADYGDTLLNPLIARLSAWARGGGAGITAGRGIEAIEEGTLGVGDGGEDRSIKRLSKASP